MCLSQCALDYEIKLDFMRCMINHIACQFNIIRCANPPNFKIYIGQAAPFCSNRWVIISFLLV